MSAPDQDPTRRFSSRVADYVKYRPSYPRELLEGLREAGALKAGDVVADVGFGTGLLTRVFLEAGYEVVGVEPNAEMRAAGEAELAGFAGFRSVEGTAEATGLEAGSVDLVTAGQAFHWFDREKAKAEFRRILRAGGHVALIWNERLVEASPFLVAYDGLLKEFSTDYGKVDHRQMTPEVLAGFFAPLPMRVLTYPHRQVFDFAGVRGRLLSSSYAPGEGHPRHAAMVEELRRIFEVHEREGKVVSTYETVVYVGRIH